MKLHAALPPERERTGASVSDHVTILAAKSMAAVSVVRCVGCGTRLDDEAWSTLPLAERVDPSEVSRLVRDWPAQICIEVRRCPQCRRTIAAKRLAER